MRLITIDGAEERGVEQRIRSATDRRERQARFLGYVQQRMAPIGHVQYPQQTHFEVGRVRTAGVAVQSATAKLRLALRVEVDVRAVVLEDLDDGESFLQGILKGFSRHEIEVVVRSVVFRKPSVGSSGEAPDGEVEAGRAILALVVAVGD